jgi:protein-L-isoaspartate(D-aspartate) O-methyltransferase
MPSIMAVMLEALDVHMGNRVLEIGTGTGFNAALLSILTGDASLVTSIDCENARALSDAARHTLRALVGTVNIIIGDGFQGVLQDAQYDRIIATASAPTIPDPWIEQLAPNGILVMDLQGPLESGFLVFTKNSDGNGGNGQFLKRSLHFMPLVSENVSSIFVDTNFLFLIKPQTHQKKFHVDGDSIVHLLLKDHPFRWFFQWYFPGCNIVEMNSDSSQKMFVVNYDKQSILQFQKDKDGWAGDVFGECQLWDIIQESLNIFKQIGEPKQTDYSVEVGSKRKTISVNSFHLPSQLK